MTPSSTIAIRFPALAAVSEAKVPAAPGRNLNATTGIPYSPPVSTFAVSRSAPERGTSVLTIRNEPSRSVSSVVPGGRSLAAAGLSLESAKGSPSSMMSFSAVRAFSDSSTMRNSSKAVLPTSSLAWAEFVMPGSCSTIQRWPCRVTSGSATPNWSTRLRMISIAWPTASCTGTAGGSLSVSTSMSRCVPPLRSSPRFNSHFGRWRDASSCARSVASRPYQLIDG